MTRKENKLGFTDDQHYNLIWRQNPVALAIVSADGMIVSANAALSKLLGYAEAELELLRFQDITDPRDLDADQEQLRRVKAHEIESYSMVKRYITKQGRTLWARLYMAPVLDHRGNVDHFIATILELPNHGNYKVEHHDHEVIVRPSLTVGQFMADNWKWFVGFFAASLLAGAPIIWRLAVFVDKLKKHTGVEW